MNEHAEYFKHVIDTCVECQLCMKIQRGSGCHECNYSNFARSMLDAMAREEFGNVADPVWSCTLCEACTARCPAQISAYDFVHHARCVLNPEQPLIVKRFNSMLPDPELNSFAQLRKIFKPPAPDALDEKAPCRKLFFPGCSLGTYASELACTVYDYLRSEGISDGISYRCCGNPCYLVGSSQLVRQTAASLIENLGAHGVEEIVVACPSCYATLLGYKEHADVDCAFSLTPLPVVLAEQGLTIDPEYAAELGFDTVCIKDACRDRNSGDFAMSVRKILGSLSVIELEHNRRDSRCCGSGGLVPLYDSSVSDDKRWAVLQEFDDTEASCLITMCMNCSVALRQDGDTNIFHYLELLFGKPVDWNALERRLAAANRPSCNDHCDPFFLQQD